MNRMSDDLIRRKAVLNILTEARVKDSILCSPAFVEMLTQRIKKIPTAFDKEKVIEQIKVLSTGIILNTNICDDYAEGYVRAAKDIIEIVEKGGIE